MPADASAVPGTPGARARVVVLLSGAGSLCAALLAATDEPGYPAEVVAVGADRPDAGGLALAADRGIDTFVVAVRDHPDRASWDRALAAELVARRPDWVVSAGFMKLLGPAVLAPLAGRVVNTHPALLPAFPGAHAVRDALAAGVATTGATVHLVDAGLDTGPVLTQLPVPVHAGDDEASLHERIKTVERELLVRTVAALATGAPVPALPTPGSPTPAVPTEESTR
ncbi:phosphoribosylglycinamide formyltransferase [Modestobacter roseus]|uniref:Phosphoribosylglycinamide formyltransferase n=1 Tax=Modestobacter roseus TaxID=1181884 RepID=A0A562IUD7_9ACTN|nr:phosphoribosylglycinamide formyltransferase [Modestobacter roseus]MQA35178.1 phosphoribosylglycinamide formyltransferase [Modestobacter roseus]TWH74295.1 phosphoribosylglycinamide formyltransferase-1 [Modestobacter roseus]